jgi:hypothetical protein
MCPHVEARRPTGWISVKFDTGDIKICRENPKSFKIGIKKISGTLREYLSVFVAGYKNLPLNLSLQVKRYHTVNLLATEFYI